jgi:hypothetical protein
MTFIIGLILVVVAIFIFKRSRRSASAIAVENPEIVLVQVGNASQADMDVDRAAYSQFYSRVSAKTVGNLKELTEYINSSSPDLLHLFVDLDQQGNVFDDAQQKMKFGELQTLAQNRGANYIFFAKDNPGSGYSAGPRPELTSNLIMTLERKGSNFPEFLSKVFSQVSKGETLPMAWNKVSPQIPGKVHKDSPEVFAGMGAGNVVLKGDK